MKNQQQIKSLFFEKISKIIFLLTIFFLPTQFGKYFFFDFSYLNGLRVDYLAIKIFFIDILIFILFVFNLKKTLSFLTKKNFLLFYLFLIINFFISTKKFLTLFFIIKIFEFLIFFFLSTIYFSKIKPKNILIVFLLIGIAELFLSFYQFIFGHSVGSLFYFLGERLISISTPGIAKIIFENKEFLRAYGTFSHPNSLAGFFLALYFFVLTEKKFQKDIILKYLNLLIFNLLIFLSFSKTAIICFLILNTVYFLKNKSKCFICNISKIFTPIILSLFFLLGNTDILTFNKRIFLLAKSIMILKNNFLLGVGLNNYLFFQSQIPDKLALFFNQPVHNIFLLLLTEIGIFGLIIILFLFLKINKILTINLYLTTAIFITGFFDHYWLTLNQNFLLMAFIYGSVSSSFFIFKLRSRS
ncbi:MAG: hypothetical protein KatS3mg092_0363 [Patescibacteria group bacterium]|nr:MAG: hypothetical protein KatS3mg092_0363 [Patescibacteria group bacterium]